MLPCGKIHAYTGDGKGKTTAAFGLALRALAADLNVVIVQFMKNIKYGETILSSFSDKVEILQYGSGCIFDRGIEERDKEKARAGLAYAIDALENGKCDVLILDEVIVAISLGLLEENDVLALLNRKKPHQEIVMTGRYASEALIAACDLVTEMKCHKHYFDSEGLTSRKGIEH